MYSNYYFRPTFHVVLEGTPVPEDSMMTVTAKMSLLGTLVYSYRLGGGDVTTTTTLENVSIPVCNWLLQEKVFTLDPSNLPGEAPVITIVLPKDHTVKALGSLGSSMCRLWTGLNRAAKQQRLKKVPSLLWATLTYSSSVSLVSSTSWLTSFAQRSQRVLKTKPTAPLDWRTGLRCVKCGEYKPVFPKSVEFCKTCMTCDKCHTEQRCPKCQVLICSYSAELCEHCGLCRACCKCVKCGSCQASYVDYTSLGACIACSHCHACCHCMDDEVSTLREIRKEHKHRNSLIALMSGYYTLVDLQSRLLRDDKVEESVKGYLDGKVKKELNKYVDILDRGLQDHLTLACVGELRHIRGRLCYRDGNVFQLLSALPTKLQEMFNKGPLTREHVYEQAVEFNPTELLKLCLVLFNLEVWGGSVTTYGGTMWAKIALAALEREKYKAQEFVELGITLCHNGTYAAFKPTWMWSCSYGTKAVALMNRAHDGSVLDYKFPELLLSPEVISIMNECETWGLVDKSAFSHREIEVYPYESVKWGMTPLQPYSKFIEDLMQDYEKIRESVRTANGRTIYREKTYN